MPQKITRVGGHFWKHKWKFNNNVYSYRHGCWLGLLFVVLVVVPLIVAFIAEVVK